MMGASKHSNFWSCFCYFMLLTFKVCSSLKCYQCISLECSQSHLFCDTVKEYVLDQLPEVYHTYEGQKVPMCPSPTNDDEGWDELKEGTKIDCEEEKAACVLGRFQVTTEIFETGKNITSYGISMGCAKRTLLKLTKQAAAKNECDLSTSSSRLKHSLRHNLQLEHCARIPDMCHSEDFCVPPYATEIRKFQNETPPRGISFMLILGIFILLALAVIILTFMAPFFNG